MLGAALRPKRDGADPASLNPYRQPDPPYPGCKSWWEGKSAVTRSPGAPIDSGQSEPYCRKVAGERFPCVPLNTVIPGPRPGLQNPGASKTFKTNVRIQLDNERIWVIPSREARPASRFCCLPGTLGVPRGCACLGTLLKFSALRPACSFF